jgi:hypothetical protein
MNYKLKRRLLLPFVIISLGLTSGCTLGHPQNKESSTSSNDSTSNNYDDLVMKDVSNLSVNIQSSLVKYPNARYFAINQVKNSNALELHVGDNVRDFQTTSVSVAEGSNVILNGGDGYGTFTIKAFHPLAKIHNGEYQYDEVSQVSKQSILIYDSANRGLQND